MTVAESIVEAILRELHGRCGVGDELGLIRADNPFVYQEMTDSLVGIVRDKLAGHYWKEGYGVDG